MSPLNIKKLNLIRVKLDKLDNDLLKLIKKRSNLVNEVLKIKSKKKEIIDQNRITFILKKIKKKSVELKIDPKITKILLFANLCVDQFEGRIFDGRKRETECFV